MQPESCGGIQNFITDQEALVPHIRVTFAVQSQVNVAL